MSPLERDALPGALLDPLIDRLKKATRDGHAAFALIPEALEGLEKAREALLLDPAPVPPAEAIPQVPATVRVLKGPTIMLASGRYFDLEAPDQCPFDIEDIAHALSHLCRYTGHCREFYSVAQHSVLVSHIVPPENAMAGLLHDAPEAFIGDVSKPLKILLPDYSKVERRVEAAVFRRFGLPAELPASVKHADRVMLRTEQRDLMGADDHVWTFTRGTEPLAERIVPMPPRQARDAFLARFAALSQDKGSAA